MQRKTTTVTRKVRVLTDPRPEFVSLVDAGANRTPFAAVKRDHKEKSAMQIDGIVPASGHDVARIAFAAASFADETAVKAWMDGKGFENYEVEAVDGGFQVANKAAAFAGPEEEIPLDGVSVFVAQVAEAAPAAEPAAKADEQVSAQPVSDHEPNEQTAAMKEAGMILAARNAVSDDASLRRKSYCNIAYLVQVLSDLRWVLDEAEWEREFRSADQATAEALKEHIRGLSAVLAKMVADEAAFVTGAEEAAKSEGAAKADEIPAAAEAPATESAEKADVETAPAPEADAVATAPQAVPAADPAIAALKAMVGEMAQSIKALTETVSTVAAKQAETAETAAKADELADRLASVEAQGQTRKSADVEDARAGTQARAAKVDDRLTRNLLGAR